MIGYRERTFQAPAHCTFAPFPAACLCTRVFLRAGWFGQFLMAIMARSYDGEITLLRATISELKDGLSAYLRRVKSGESILITDRKTPVARIVPIGRGEEDTTVVDEMEMDAKPLRLEHAGIVVRRSPKSPLDVLGPPLRAAGAGILEALLEEREEERREGRR